jgi:hypothetical protein
MQLPWHLERLVGDIAALDVPENWDSNEPHDLLVATDGSVVFGGGYHSWVIPCDSVSSWQIHIHGIHNHTLVGVSWTCL